MGNAAAAASPAPPAIEMAGISKRFGATRALDDVAFTAHAGEVHALLGENGAGKSTLMYVLAGIYHPDRGTMQRAGAGVVFRSPADAINQGIGIVHQHFELVQALSVFDNIVLGAERRSWRLNRQYHRRHIAELAERYGFSVDLDRRVQELEIGDQQKVEILRILYAGVDVLILDEPTTHLTPAEVERLFGLVRELTGSGLTVILIAHKLREVLAIAGRVTVLRRGKLVGTIDAAAATEAALVGMMMGGGDAIAAVTRESRAGREPAEAVAMSLRGAGTAADRRAVQLTDLDLDVREGELVGVAGVAGNGQRELVELLAGLRAATHGAIRVCGRDLTRTSVADRIRAGVAVVPGDRLIEGILGGGAICETYALGLHQMWRDERWSPALMRERARHMIAEFDVTAPHELAVTATMSGGNIQKVIVARALAISAGCAGGVIVAMNPTSGLDVRAAGFVHEQLLRACAGGRGLLLISEDLDELMALADRIVVLHQGHFVAAYPRAGFDRYAIGARMVGSDG